MDNKRQELEINHVCYDVDINDGDNEYSDGNEEESDNTDTYSDPEDLDQLDKHIEDKDDAYIELYTTKIKKNRECEELEWNSATPEDMEQKVAKAIVVEMFINGKSCWVLLDSGSLGDFISSTTVNQLKIKTEVLAKPMGLAMAVAGSQGVIKHSATVNIKYQEINGTYHLCQSPQDSDSDERSGMGD
ncbi:hypothetical protein FRC12_001018 [Ceratobasidium sp. 428]|nr:hypothetical protein FRC12_001018 [Ceratobasidium sp. 428]